MPEGDEPMSKQESVPKQLMNQRECTGDERQIQEGLCSILTILYPRQRGD
jgi:hypothetical protein